MFLIPFFGWIWIWAQEAKVQPEESEFDTWHLVWSAVVANHPLWHTYEGRSFALTVAGIKPPLAGSKESKRSWYSSTSAIASDSCESSSKSSKLLDDPLGVVSSEEYRRIAKLNIRSQSVRQYNKHQQGGFCSAQTAYAQATLLIWLCHHAGQSNPVIVPRHEARIKILSGVMQKRAFSLRYCAAPQEQAQMKASSLPHTVRRPLWYGMVWPSWIDSVNSGAQDWTQLSTRPKALKPAPLMLTREAQILDPNLDPVNRPRVEAGG